MFLACRSQPGACRRGPIRDNLSPVTDLRISPDQLGDLVAVLDLVRSGSARTRPELGRRSGLGRTVITQRVGHLMRACLIEDGELGLSSGGRAPRELRFRSEAGVVLAAELGATSISTGITDLSGRLLAHREEAADIGQGPEPVLARVRTMLDELLAESSGAPVWGVGVGLPGPVEFAMRQARRAADHARMGRLPGARTPRGALRRACLGGQRGQHDDAGRVPDGGRAGGARLPLREDRHRDRSRPDLRRPVAPGEPRVRRGHRPHRGAVGELRRLPLREHRLSGGAGERRGAGARRCGRRARRQQPGAGGTACAAGTRGRGRRGLGGAKGRPRGRRAVGARRAG